MTMNEGGDVRCAEEVILEESEEEVVSQMVTYYL